MLPFSDFYFIIHPFSPETIFRAHILLRNPCYSHDFFKIPNIKKSQTLQLWKYCRYDVFFFSFGLSQALAVAGLSPLLRRSHSPTLFSRLCSTPPASPTGKLVSQSQNQVKKVFSYQQMWRMMIRGKRLIWVNKVILSFVMFQHVLLYWYK